jgi:teichuronic acid biosynthesis glycosyltransferase TuaG
MSNSTTKGNPLISIITPAYNSERFINETIESVIAQTYTNWEMIIVDDCSTDDTLKEIEQYNKEKRIKIVRLKENSGPAIARNVAIKHASGHYLAFLDSDDLWLPEKLEQQLIFMQENQIAFSFTKYLEITESGLETNVIKIPDEVNYQQLLKNNVIGCLTVMLDTKKIGEVEMADIPTRQDYVLWLSLCRRGFTAYGLQKELAKYRIVENSLSRNKLKVAKQNWKVYRQIERLSFVKSSWYFMHYMYFKLKKYLV